MFYAIKDAKFTIFTDDHYLSVPERNKPLVEWNNNRSDNPVEVVIKGVTGNQDHAKAWTALRSDVPVSIDEVTQCLEKISEGYLQVKVVIQETLTSNDMTINKMMDTITIIVRHETPNSPAQIIFKSTSCF